MAGASAVQVGTANFYQPTAAMDIIAGLERYVQDHGLGTIRSVINSLQA